MDDSLVVFKKVGRFSFIQLKQVATILNSCGKDMANKYDLHHWDNSLLKTFLIVVYCSLRNDVFLLYKSNNPIATFMTRKNGAILHFEKLGTIPSEAGKGKGSICMAKIEDLAREEGCQTITMEVYEPSKHAISFYQHKGFIVTGVINTRKYREIKMEKRI